MTESGYADLPVLPPEVWMQILRKLTLDVLWMCARPVCVGWNDIAQEIARSILYSASECEISTLVNEYDQFQHYEGDFLYPILKHSNNFELIFSSPDPNCLKSAAENQRLVWLRKGRTVHEWTSFTSPQEMWPNVIKYRSASEITLRLNYKSEFNLIPGCEKLFSRETAAVISGRRRADWRIRVKLDNDGDESLASVSIQVG